MARPRSSGYDGQREQILAAAAALFARQGYTASTMNQVAAACGVSKATLYHYVRDKHALLAQIARGHVERLQALVAEVAGLGLAPEAHLRVLIEHGVDPALAIRFATLNGAHRYGLRDLGAIPDENGIYRCPPPDPNAKPADPAVLARVLSELRLLGCLLDDPDAPQ